MIKFNNVEFSIAEEYIIPMILLDDVTPAGMRAYCRRLAKRFVHTHPAEAPLEMIAGDDSSCGLLDDLRARDSANDILWEYFPPDQESKQYFLFHKNDDHFLYMIVFTKYDH